MCYTGNKHSIEIKEKISISMKKIKLKDPFKHDKSICKNCGKQFEYFISNKRDRKFCSLPCYWTFKKRTNIYNRELTEEHKNKISESHKGEKHPMFGRCGKKNPRYGLKHTAEAKKKMRMSAIKRIEKSGNKMAPNYSQKACNWFKFFDKINNIQGFYGSNEHLIGKLGYWPDYINFDMKLIVEWDENHHYKSGKLLEKDVERQKKIQEHYPDFEFIRVRMSV